MELKREKELRDKIVSLIETSGKKLLPSAQAEMLAMISEYKDGLPNPTLSSYEMPLPSDEELVIAMGVSANDNLDKHDNFNSGISYKFGFRAGAEWLADRIKSRQTN